MMRVLVASDAWEPQINGVVRSLQQVRDRAPALGFETDFVTPDAFRSFPMPGYPEIRLAMASTRALLQRIDAFRPDIIHIATEGPIGLAARNACLACGLPFDNELSHALSRISARTPARALGALLCSAQALSRCRGWHSRFTPSLEADLAMRGLKNLMRWSRGVDLTQYSPRQSSNTSLKRPIFLNVGRVAVEKNLEAFLSLDLPGTKMVVGDGPARASLAARFPDAVFTGAKTGAELAELYRQADIFVFPSRTDTFGVVLLEALASGLPVAAYPVMGPQDVIGDMKAGDAKAGVLAEDLRAAALACFDINPQACLALAARYDWDASIRQFRDNLMEAAGRAPARRALTPAHRALRASAGHHS